MESSNPTSKPSSIGFVDVFVHEARDIQNICIYHKQDVYAKLRLTGDPPESAAVSTRTINGGGRNPVFNQSLRLGVSTVESSVRCEVWMLSRVRNYLEDQLLGFALVPLSDVVMAGGGKLVEEEFTLSSTDLFHSPSGFIKLSVEYFGSSAPDVLVPVPSPSAKPSAAVSEEGDGTAPCGLDRIEFPDLNVANENKMMVSEYFGIPCNNLDAHDPESSICPDDDDGCPNHEAGVRVVESFATVTHPDPPVDKEEEEGNGSSSLGVTENAFPPPIINIDIEPQHSVVQQDIVDMYMKSMQQFTESLANMKLPMGIENGNGNGNINADGSSNGSGGGSVDAANGDSGADQKLLASKKTNSRVFYGSRAFF